ncbi:MAG: hypothetical protein OXU20_01405, partial [Myxococcales bacterium]|nr:hypothetical protein [Myxococcales bacterium]
MMLVVATTHRHSNRRLRRGFERPAPTVPAGEGLLQIAALTAQRQYEWGKKNSNLNQNDIANACNEIFEDMYAADNTWKQNDKTFVRKLTNEVVFSALREKSGRRFCSGIASRP